ncbi:hypothetical protein McanMca71_008029 [Microsporum canis]
MVPPRSWSKGHQSNRLSLLSRLVPPGPRSESFWATWPALLKMVPWTAGRGTTGPSKMAPLRSWSKGPQSNRLCPLSRTVPPGPRSESFWSKWPALLKMVPWGRGPRAVDHGTVQNGPPPIVVQGASFEPASSPESNGTAGTTIRRLLDHMARTSKNGPAGPSKMAPLRSWSKGSHSNRLRLLSRLGPLPRPYDASKAPRPASLKMAPPVRPPSGPRAPPPPPPLGAPGPEQPIDTIQPAIGHR